MIGLNKLGFTPEMQAEIEELAQQPNGMLLSTGPTGHGKTTTQYSLLNKLNTVERNILTIEDPCEYVLSGVTQVQVNKKAGLTFSRALRSFLRQDPDIIMVGEMRDLETAEIAIESALTGHLVLSTLHTNDAPSATIRLDRHGHRAVPYLGHHYRRSRAAARTPHLQQLQGVLRGSGRRPAPFRLQAGRPVADGAVGARKRLRGLPTYRLQRTYRLL